jgi:hypothetical protein
VLNKQTRAGLISAPENYSLEFRASFHLYRFGKTDFRIYWRDGERQRMNVCRHGVFFKLTGSDPGGQAPADGRRRYLSTDGPCGRSRSFPSSPSRWAEDQILPHPPGEAGFHEPGDLYVRRGPGDRLSTGGTGALCSEATAVLPPMNIWTIRAKHWAEEIPGGRATIRVEMKGV